MVKFEIEWEPVGSVLFQNACTIIDLRLTNDKHPPLIWWQQDLGHPPISPIVFPFHLALQWARHNSDSTFPDEVL